MMKRALGRGLGALLPPRPEEASDAGGRLRDLSLDRLIPNPGQPRRSFTPESLAELAASIRSAGVLEPILVRPRGEQFEIIVGERRWRAAQLAGLATIPALVREATDAEALELGLVENLLREDLNPLEEAQAYQRLLAEFGWTQEDLAQRIGRDRSSIANVLRLLRLPAGIQEDLRAGRLTMGHARALLALPTEAEQQRLRDVIVALDWSVRTTEARVQARRRPRARPGRRPADIEALQEELRLALGVRVRLVGTLVRGRLEFPYGSPTELEHLHALLTASQRQIPQIPINRS